MVYSIITVAFSMCFSHTKHCCFDKINNGHVVDYKQHLTIKENPLEHYPVRLIITLFSLLNHHC